MSARTLHVMTLYPKDMFRDHASGCTDGIGCDPAGLASPTCDVGEALHRVATRPQPQTLQPRWKGPL